MVSHGLFIKHCMAMVWKPFFQGVAHESCAKLLVEEHVLRRSTCNFYPLALLCPYHEGLGLKLFMGMIGRSLAMSHHEWAGPLQQVDDLCSAEALGNIGWMDIIRY